MCRTSTEPWMEVVVGDRRGELVHTEAQASAIHERLSHLTSEHWVSITACFFFGGEGSIMSLRY